MTTRFKAPLVLFDQASDLTAGATFNAAWDELTVQLIKDRTNKYQSEESNLNQYISNAFLKAYNAPEEIFCLVWNCCGLKKQTVGADKNEKSFKDLLILLNPDIICLNELKAKDEDVKLILSGLPGYSFIACRSSSNGVSKRGSAIIYRNSDRFRVDEVGIDGWKKDQTGNEKEIEAVSIHITTCAGKQYRLINMYVAGTNNYFDEAVKIVRKLSSKHAGVRNLVVGDLNMHKEKFINKWKEVGFMDSLHPSWPTNKTGDTLSAIDYVLYDGPTSPLVCHRPILADNVNFHLVIPFTIGPSSDDSCCKDPECVFKC